MHREKGRWRTEREGDCLHGKEASEGTNLAGYLILDFQPLELWANKLLLFKSPGLWYFVTADLSDQYIIQPHNLMVSGESCVTSLLRYYKWAMPHLHPS